MASLKKINGSYYAYFYSSTRTPKSKSVALKTTRKDIAMKRHTRVEFEYEEGTFDPWSMEYGSSVSQHISIKDAVALFLQDRSDLRPASVKAYKSILEILVNQLPPDYLMGHIKAGDIKKLLCETAVFTDRKDKTRVTPATRRYRYRHLQSFFSWSVKSGYLKSNPMSDIKPPKEGDPIKGFLEKEEVERLLRAIDGDFEINRKGGYARDGEVLWLKDVVLLAVNTGLRISELTSLEWDAVNLRAQPPTLIVRNTARHATKSGRERIIPLVAKAVEVLERLDENRIGPLVFTNRHGEALSPVFVSKRFKKYVRLARLREDMNFHGLRHTCASWLVQEGVPLQMVQKILGHSSVNVTERYGHLAPDTLVAAMKVIDQKWATMAREEAITA